MAGASVPIPLIVPTPAIVPTPGTGRARQRSRAVSGVLAALVCLSAQAGCAWIVTGTKQAVLIESNPTGAVCRVMRGAVILRQVTTPDTVTVQRRSDDLTVRCSKDGVGSGSAALTAGIESWVYGNAVSGGLIGWGVDAAVGADNAYPDRVLVSLGPAGPAPAGFPPAATGRTIAAALPGPTGIPAPPPVQAMPVQAMPVQATPVQHQLSPAAPVPAASRYGVHLGAYSSLQQAQQAWGFYRNIAGGRVTDANAFVTQRAIAGGIAYDLYAAKLSQQRAVDFCAHLLDQQQNCQVVYY